MRISFDLFMQISRRPVAQVMALACTLCLLAGVATAWAQGGGKDQLLCLTLLHNNDAESQLLNAGSGLEEFGGAARFVGLVREQRRDARQNGCSGLLSEAAAGDGESPVARRVLTLSSGDNFLAGPEFNASLAKGVPFFDSLVVNAVGYDALALGNHEFDFGPDVLADFISGVSDETGFLSANLDFSREPRLQALVERGRIAKSVVIRKGDSQIGIVGATTEELASISSPRDTVIKAVAPAVQAEVDALKARGVEIVVLISHLQGVKEDLALLPRLSGIDVAIAGGGDELLSNPGDLLVPKDAGTEFGPYPLRATGADGSVIPVVTTPGDLKYIGRLEVLFDRGGKVVAFAGGPVRVAGGGNPDAVAPDKRMESTVAAPVQAFVDQLASTVIGNSEVALEGRKAPGVRTGETNLGNLLADALLQQATRLAGDFGVDAPDVALQNGGGIRNNTLIPAGDVTLLTTFDIAPFSNFVSVVKDLPAARFKQVLERAVSQTPAAAGRFAQVAGFTMVYDPSRTAQEQDADGKITVAGQRVRELTLDDGTAIVRDGALVPGARAVNLATVDFLARGGDGYPFQGAPFTALGVTYQQALENFIKDSLSGKITAADYPEGGKGRVTP